LVVLGIITRAAILMFQLLVISTVLQWLYKVLKLFLTSNVKYNQFNIIGQIQTVLNILIPSLFVLLVFFLVQLLWLIHFFKFTCWKHIDICIYLYL